MAFVVAAVPAAVAVVPAAAVAVPAAVVAVPGDAAEADGAAAAGVDNRGGDGSFDGDGWAAPAWAVETIAAVAAGGSCPAAAGRNAVLLHPLDGPDNELLGGAEGDAGARARVSEAQNGSVEPCYDVVASAAAPVVATAVASASAAVHSAAAANEPGAAVDGCALAEAAAVVEGAADLALPSVWQILVLLPPGQHSR